VCNVSRLTRTAGEVTKAIIQAAKDGLRSELRCADILAQRCERLDEHLAESRLEDFSLLRQHWTVHHRDELLDCSRASHCFEVVRDDAD
jgi:hypothetical protein